MDISRLALYEDCTGCLACYNACSFNAIELKNDDEGFVRPYVNSKKCVECNTCSKVCPPLHKNDANKLEQQFDQIALAGWSKNKHVRRTSTSGGVFFELAIHILNQNGVVYGAALNENNVVEHQRIDNIRLLHKLQGSKYVQSFIGNIYKRVRDDLVGGRLVMFSGTPCQIKGLRLFLHSIPTDKLIMIDLLCHGVPSPMVYHDYLRYLESLNQSKIVCGGIYFRDKKYSWTEYNMLIKFISGKKYISTNHQDPFLRGFLRDYYLRPSCHNCLYSNVDRPGDITLGDFWGFSSQGIKDYDDDKGISLILLNTKKAVDFISSVKTLKIFKRQFDTIASTNINFQGPFKPNVDRHSFWMDYREREFDYIVQKYLYPEELTDWVKNRMKRKTIKAKFKYLYRKYKMTKKK